MKTAEAVTYLHPDKICDQISDAIVDECLKADKNSRVAVEAMGGHGMISLIGEVTCKEKIDYEFIAQKVYHDLTGKYIKVISNITQQAGEIAKGVNKGGAGDQGIMVGYATSETLSGIPLEVALARRILSPFNADGKSQVTLDNEDKITDVVLSVQGKSQKELKKYLQELTILDRKTNLFCNNTGSFETGGFDADSGLTGRKIVCDAYGPQIPVGGGAFSGKDPTKVDRSGAYMARFIAKDILKDFPKAKWVMVKLAYVIGKSEPIMATFKMEETLTANITNSRSGNVNLRHYDCRPEAIIEKFSLRRPIYRDLAKYGHFGRPELPWEQV